MKFFFNILLLLLFINFSFSQNKISTSVFSLTDELPFQINISDSEEIFIAGRISSFTSDECYISKHDSNGNFLWAKIIGGANYDYFQKIIFNENNIICGGNTNSFGNSQNFYAVQFNEIGDTVFSKILGGKNYEKLLEIILVEENFLMGGSSNSFGSINNNDLLLIKTDSMANPLWTKKYEGGGEEIIHSIKKSGNDFVLSGNTTSFGAGMKDVFVMKTDTSGNLQWLKCFGATDDEDAIDMIVANENIYLCGYTKSVSNWQDLWLLKLDSAGNLLWNKVVDFGLNEKGNKIFYRNGKIFVCGYLQTFTGTYDDIFVLTIDENGENISAKNFPVPGFEYGNFIGEISEKMLVAGFKSDSVKMKIFEIDDSLFSCNSSSISFDTSSIQVLTTDTVFTVNSIPVDSLVQMSGGDFADYGNAFVNVGVCPLPLNSSEFGVRSSETIVFPNPNDGKFGVRSSEFGKLQIFSILGEIIYSTQLSTINYQLSTNLPSGIYFLQITAEKFSHTEKIIVQDF